MSHYFTAVSRDRGLSFSSTTSSCNNAGPAAPLPRLPLHHNKPDLIELSSSDHSVVQEEVLDLSLSFAHEPSSWHASKPDENGHRSATSPPPFSELLEEKKECDSEGRHFMSEFSRRHGRCWPLAQRSFSKRQRQSHIVLHQQTTSEICLPAPSSLLLPGSPFARHPCASEEIIRPAKAEFSRRRIPSSARSHRLSISLPLPESFVKFQPTSSECLPSGMPSFQSRSNSRHSFRSAPHYPSNVLLHSSHWNIPGPALPTSKQSNLLGRNSKFVSLIVKICNQIKKRNSKKKPSLNQRRPIHTSQ